MAKCIITYGIEADGVINVIDYDLRSVLERTLNPRKHAAHFTDGPGGLVKVETTLSCILVYLGLCLNFKVCYL